MPSKYSEIASLPAGDQLEVVRGELTRSWEAYYAYSSGLRTWFVAYGIGALALFVTNASEFEHMLKPARLACAVLFLGGAFVQIALTWMNKVGNFSWFKYWDEYFSALAKLNGDVSELAKQGCLPPGRLYNQSFAVEIALDILSGALFFAGTAVLVIALV